jgi:hypothetical protein
MLRRVLRVGRTRAGPVTAAQLITRRSNPPNRGDPLVMQIAIPPTKNQTWICRQNSKCSAPARVSCHSTSGLLCAVVLLSHPISHTPVTRLTFPVDTQRPAGGRRLPLGLQTCFVA